MWDMPVSSSVVQGLGRLECEREINKRRVKSSKIEIDKFEKKKYHDEQPTLAVTLVGTTNPYLISAFHASEIRAHHPETYAPPKVYKHLLHLTVRQASWAQLKLPMPRPFGSDMPLGKARYRNLLLWVRTVSLPTTATSEPPPPSKENKRIPPREWRSNRSAVANSHPFTHGCGEVEHRSGVSVGPEIPPSSPYLHCATAMLTFGRPA
jgi:hypothetical protein